MDIRFYFSFFLVYLKQNKFLNPFFTPLHAVYLSLLLFLILVAHIPINAVMLPLCCVSHQNIVSFIFHHRFFIVKCVCLSLDLRMSLDQCISPETNVVFFNTVAYLLKPSCFTIGMPIFLHRLVSQPPNIHVPFIRSRYAFPQISILTLDMRISLQIVSQ